MPTERLKKNFQKIFVLTFLTHFINKKRDKKLSVLCLEGQTKEILFSFFYKLFLNELHIKKFSNFTLLLSFTSKFYLLLSSFSIKECPFFLLLTLKIRSLFRYENGLLFNFNIVLKGPCTYDVTFGRGDAFKILIFGVICTAPKYRQWYIDYTLLHA